MIVTFEEVDTRQYACRRCKSKFKIALPSVSDQKSLAEVGKRNRMELVKALRESVRCDLADAKGVAFHTAVIPGSCHRCNASLPLNTLVDCDNCGSLNVQLGFLVPLLPCPACGFVVLGPRFGSYDICPLCGWEDDAVQLANPTSGGGANGESLAEAQAKAIHRFPLQERVASGTSHMSCNAAQQGGRCRPTSGGQSSL